MADYIVSDTELTATAEAVRQKGGTSALIPWQAGTGFKAAVDAIPSGGGGMSIDWADVTEVTVGANSVSNTQGVANFFSTFAPYILIVLASGLTTNNQFVSSNNSSNSGTNWMQRWRNGSISATTIGPNYDCVLPQGSKYLVFVEK